MVMLLQLVVQCLLTLAAAEPLLNYKGAAKPAFCPLIQKVVSQAKQQSSASAYCSSYLGVTASTVTVFTSTSTSVTTTTSTSTYPEAFTTASTTFPNCSPPSAYTAPPAAKEKRAYGAKSQPKPKPSCLAGYASSVLSSACKCLSVTASKTTVNAVTTTTSTTTSVTAVYSATVYSTTYIAFQLQASAVGSDPYAVAIDGKRAIASANVQAHAGNSYFDGDRTTGSVYRLGNVLTRSDSDGLRFTGDLVVLKSDLAPAGVVANQEQNKANGSPPSGDVEFTTQEYIDEFNRQDFSAVEKEKLRCTFSLPAGQVSPTCLMTCAAKDQNQNYVQQSFYPGLWYLVESNEDTDPHRFDTYVVSPKL